MTKDEFSKRLRREPLIVDGATGSCLLAAGMPRGVSTELWILEHPEQLISLQKDYIAAGSQAIYAPTFRANRIAMDDMRIEREVPEFVHKLVALSREASGGRVLIAGDLGTSGRLPAPYGPATYDQIFSCYAEQVAALAEAGVDFLVAETLLTTDEAVAILDAAASVCDLPVVCSLTIEADGRLLFGGTIFEAAADLEAMGAAAVGCNCSVGPNQLEAVIRTLHQQVSVPIIAKPNAGLPDILPDGQAVYSMGAEEFASHMNALQEAGASILGGCCGTTPDYVRAMCRALGNAERSV